MPSKKSPNRNSGKSPSSVVNDQEVDPLDFLVNQVRSMGIGAPTYALVGGYVELSITTYGESEQQIPGFIGLPISLMEFFNMKLGQLVEIKVTKSSATRTPLSPKSTHSFCDGEVSELFYILRANIFNGSDHAADITGMAFYYPKISAKKNIGLNLLVRPYKAEREMFLHELKLNYIKLAKEKTRDLLGVPSWLNDEEENYFKTTLTNGVPLHNGMMFKMVVNGAKRAFKCHSDLLVDGVVGYVEGQTLIELENNMEENKAKSESSKESFAKIFGQNMNELTSLVTRRFSVGSKKGVCCSAVVSGSFGTGKRALIQSVVNIVGAKLVAIDTEERYDKLIERLAFMKGNTVVMIPNLETFVMRSFGSFDSSDQDTDKVARLRSSIFTLRQSEASVFVVATTECFDDLGLGSDGVGCFPFEFHLSALTDKDRETLFRHCIKLSFGSFDWEIEADHMAKIIPVSSGFTAADVVSVIKHVFTVLSDSEETQRCLESDCASTEFVERVMKLIVMQSMRTTPRIAVEAVASIPNTVFDDIGGLSDLKRQLMELVDVGRVKTLREFGIRPYTGCLLYGPPGCAKTLMARALAGETNSSFLVMSGGQLISPYVGESERKLRHLFRTARHAAPTILFFDELDALAPASNGGASGGTSRLVSALASELDELGLANETGALPVIVIGATNAPDGIDRSLLRGGRFDTCVYVGTPDKQCRRDIFSVHTRRMPIEGVQLDLLAEQTEGYTGAEIAAICQHAGRSAIRRKSRVVDEGDFQLALHNILPRTTKSMEEAYGRFGKLGNSL